MDGLFLFADRTHWIPSSDFNFRSSVFATGSQDKNKTTIIYTIVFLIQMLELPSLRPIPLPKGP